VELFGLDLYLIVGVGTFNLQRKHKSAAQARDVMSAAQARDVMKGSSSCDGAGKGAGGANALLQIRRVKSLTRFCSPLYQAPPKTGAENAQPSQRPSPGGGDGGLAGDLWEAVVDMGPDATEEVLAEVMAEVRVELTSLLCGCSCGQSCRFRCIWVVEGVETARVCARLACTRTLVHTGSCAHGLLCTRECVWKMDPLHEIWDVAHLACFVDEAL